METLTLNVLKEMGTEHYKKTRKEFFSHVEDYWADMYDAEYSLYDIRPMEKDEHERIMDISNKVGHIFFKTAKLLRNVDDDTLIQLGFPKETLQYIKLNPLSFETIIARLDLVKVGNSYKTLEINSDTPTFIKELFEVNGLVCEEYNFGNPNEKEAMKLFKAARSAIFESYETVEHFDKNKPPFVVFTAHENNIEDANTVKYIQKGVRVPSKFVSLENLQIIKGEGLFDEVGNRIDVLYRQTFPVEVLILDEDEENGENIGEWLLELVQMKKVSIINPPSAFLLQSKAIQTVIWGFYELKHSFFTEEEHEWIGEYFLPTYLEADTFIGNSSKFVKKPSFGREGDTVQIFSPDGTILMEDVNKTYSDSLPIFQQYIDLPKVKFMTEKGIQNGHEMIGSFLINGEASAIGFRVGGQITDNLSYFLPIGIIQDTN